MRQSLALLTLAPALLAAPALAQTPAAPSATDGASINLVGKVRSAGGLDTGGTVNGLTDPVGATVGGVDGAVGKLVDTANLTLATREQVRAGAEIYDTNGNSVGTVQSVEADTAVVVRSGKLYTIPVADIYQGAVGATPGLVTKLSRTEIQARTTAAIESR